VQSIVMPASPRADAQTVDTLLSTIAPATDAIVAVGSGTLNDVTKLAAFRHGCPQAIFATAPSMNGYTSLSASITIDGVKRSYRTCTPTGVFFDLRVLAASPPRLIRAGLGDSACRATAQADWLLSHLLLDRPYREAPFAMLQRDEAALLAQTRGLVAGDLEVMRSLVRTLVLSGFGMTICDGSYPASQGEHLLSHYVEMMRPPGLALSFHGEQIAVCTVAMAAIQDELMSRALPPVLEPGRVRRSDVLAHFGTEIGESCWAEVEQKQLDRAATDAVNDRLARSWDSIRARIHAVTIGEHRHRELLVAAGAPSEPADLGWSPTLFSAALHHAREIRNRYTFLDVRGDLA
jgi:glycerol-1-phosphate dehydrogenase [NAD(P)+]